MLPETATIMVEKARELGIPAEVCQCGRTTCVVLESTEVMLDICSAVAAGIDMDEVLTFVKQLNNMHTDSAGRRFIYY